MQLCGLGRRSRQGAIVGIEMSCYSFTTHLQVRPMGALPVLNRVVDTPAPVLSALHAFDDPQGIMIENFRVFLSARIEHGATLLIITEEVLLPLI